MSFQTPITVKEVVESIHKKEYLLPAIQREVVWDVDQICRLFDSLMQGYPIGSFLYWHVDRKETSSYQFYEFVRDYHERDNSHNAKADVSGEDDVTGILDGQQRFTALYVGLRGSYAYRMPRKWWNSPDAFPVRRLYLNLLGKRKEEDDGNLLYDFQFLTDEEVKEAVDDTYWFRVGEILEIKNQSGVNKYLIHHKLLNRPEEQAEFANETLFKLWAIVHESRVINYFLEKEADLEKVLNIFIRVNSGGTVLSYSDLLLSIAVAQWTTLDAREEVTRLVDELNGLGGGFNFDKDFVLKSALVLCDIPDVRFKVENFNKKNMGAIEKAWPELKTALRMAASLASSFGYTRDTLTSNLALAPIAYYLRRIGLPKNYETLAKHAEDRATVRFWLVSALVKGLFGGVSDNVLRQIRDVLKKAGDGFPLEAITEKFKGTNKSLAFTEDDIEGMLDLGYGKRNTYSVLTLLYPDVNFGHIIHTDHIHPKARFAKRDLIKAGVPESLVEEYQEKSDQLPNLQLLDGAPNEEKSDTPFEDWLKSAYADKGKRAAYCERNMIPECSYKLKDFGEFFTQRRELIRAALTKRLIQGKK
jgi:hypothetical protein